MSDRDKGERWGLDLQRNEKRIILRRVGDPLGIVAYVEHISAPGWQPRLAAMRLAAKAPAMHDALEKISRTGCWDPGEGGCIGELKCPRCTAKEVLATPAVEGTYQDGTWEY